MRPLPTTSTPAGANRSRVGGSGFLVGAGGCDEKPTPSTRERSAPAGVLVVGSGLRYRLNAGGSVHYVGRTIAVVGAIALVIGAGMITEAFGANPGITLPVGQSTVSCPGALTNGGP